jgi:tetrahydromethanopterin S-methyltransferase subunit A
MVHPMLNKNSNNDSLYPWGGDFNTGTYTKNVAIVLLNINYTPSYEVAIHGKLKTENIGIEKIVANVISNPNIRYIVICGEDIRGHQSGKSLICLHTNGIDENNRIIDAPGAIPYIENIDKEAIKRFQDQIEIIDYINNTNHAEINEKINQLLNFQTESFGEPYIAIQLKKETKHITNDTRALHSRITVDYMGKIEKRK